MEENVGRGQIGNPAWKGCWIDSVLANRVWYGAYDGQK